MSRVHLAFLALVGVVGAMIAGSALFTVDQRAQAIVLQLGEPKRVIREPGINIKLPFIQNVIYYDKRILNLDPPTEEALMSDRKRVNVDAFARYRILDPLRFFQSAKTELEFRDRFGRTLNSSVRNELGLHPLGDLLSDKRGDIMSRIQDRVNEVAKGFGVEVVDVRIGRTDLPEDISKNVYDRMRSEREREANLLRAEGDELKQKITAEADRDRTVILAEANRTAQILYGEGEGEKNRILGEAFGKDPEFFSFMRSLAAYREAMGDDTTTLILSPESDFFRFFRDQRGGAKPAR